MSFEEVGSNSLRLLARIDARYGDAFQGYYKSKTPTNPDKINAEFIQPVIDLNHDGYLDTDAIYNAGRMVDYHIGASTLEGLRENYVMLVGPEGYLGGLPSVGVPTRSHNTRILGSMVHLALTDAFIAANAGVVISFIWKMINPVDNGSFVIESKDWVVVAGQNQVFKTLDRPCWVPWDSSLAAGVYITKDATLFPAGQGLAAYATMIVRSKNTILPRL